MKAVQGKMKIGMGKVREDAAENRRELTDIFELFAVITIFMAMRTFGYI